MSYNPPPTIPTSKPSTGGGRPLPNPPSATSTPTNVNSSPSISPSTSSTNLNGTNNVQPPSPIGSMKSPPPPLKPRAKTSSLGNGGGSMGALPIPNNSNSNNSNSINPTTITNTGSGSTPTQAPPMLHTPPPLNSTTPQKSPSPPSLPKRDFPNGGSNGNLLASNTKTPSSGNLVSGITNSSSSGNLSSNLNNSSSSVNSNTSGNISSSSGSVGTVATSMPPPTTPPTTSSINISNTNSNNNNTNNNNTVYSSSAPVVNSPLVNFKTPSTPSSSSTSTTPSPSKPEPLQLPPTIPPSQSTEEICTPQKKRNSLGDLNTEQLNKMIKKEQQQQQQQQDDDDNQDDKKKKGKMFPHQWAMGKLSEKEMKKEEKERKELEKREEKERRDIEKREKKEKKEREKAEKKGDKDKDKEKDNKEKEKDKTDRPEKSLSRTSSSFAAKLKHATLRGGSKADFDDDSGSNHSSPSVSPALMSNRERASVTVSTPSGTPINPSPLSINNTSPTISVTSTSTPQHNTSSSSLSVGGHGNNNGGSNISISSSTSSNEDLIATGSSPSTPLLSSSPTMHGSNSPSNTSSTSLRSAIHLDTSRGLMTWGSASNSKLGFKLATKDLSQPTPERLPNFNIADICSISSGSYYSAALTEGGDVYMWGRGAVKNPPIPTLGFNQIEDQLLPIKIESLSEIVVISIGFYHSAAVKANGELLTWGCGESGQLGHGDSNNQIEPKVISALSTQWITQVQCGEKHTICLTKNGKVYSWGTSEYGQLGHGDTNKYCAPMLIQALDKYNVIQIASGSTHCAVLTNSKEVLVFGNGAAIGSATIVSIPTLVPSLKYLHIDKLACGHYSTAAITECGDVYTWGSGQELGHGTNQSESRPQLVEALRNQSIRQISCGGRHTAFLTDSGRIFTCGKDSFGQLGHNEGDQNKPKKIESLTKSTFISISCGENHNIALFDTTRSFRDKFCWKLLETQRTYVRTLDTIQTIFLNPLRVRDRDQLPESMRHLPYIFLSEDEIKTIFGPIEKLYALNSTVLHIMNKRFQTWSNKKKVGDVLLNHFKHSEELFNQYVENIPLALTCLDNLCKKQNSPVIGYLNACEKLANEKKKVDTDDDSKEFTLRSLLMEPLLVISRYHKSINGMVKYTKTTHIDYAGLVDLDGIMEAKVNKVQSMVNIIQNPSTLQSYATTHVTASTSDDSSAFLKEYDLKIESLQNFRKTCSKVIKSSKKYFEVEPESFKEQGHFSENLSFIKTSFDGSVDPELASSIEHFSSSIKKIGYLRSELSTRTTSAFSQPLSTVSDELEAFLPLIVEMRKRVFESHTEYESAVNKLYSLAKNLQPTDKKMIEAEKEVASLKKVLDKALVDFDSIFKEGVSIQTKSLKLFYACMKAQQEYFERGLQRFQAMKPSFDALDTFFRQQSRAQWSQSIHSVLTSTFSSSAAEKSSSNHSASPSPFTSSSASGTAASGNSNFTPSSAPSPLVLSAPAANSSSGAAGQISPSPSNETILATPKDSFALEGGETTTAIPSTPSKSTPAQPPMDPHAIMVELEKEDWSYLLDPPSANEFTETFIEDQYNQLVEILASPSLQVVQCVVSPAQVEEQSRTIESISRIFESFNKIRSIIQTGIQSEVQSTANPSTLFRSNTTATKLMTAFTKLKGMPYLQKYITPLVKEIIENPFGYEVDPSKINEGSEELMTNMMNLIQISEKFTDAIIDSLGGLPISLREISKLLQSEVIKKFPDNKHSSVGGFIFLRFLCPAIIAPHTAGLVDEAPGPEATRALVLIGKVLQNLANGIEFGQKESFMIPVNRFIIGNVNRLNSYFDRLTDVPDHKGDYISSNSKEEVQKDIRNIHILIVKNLSKVLKQLALYRQKDIIGHLSKTLVHLGDPQALYR
ncbi:hypothetical protein CYY_003074 [Polysphondylium violaceum]|uniref:Regulator of chromosome condensation domain-containing protein n=1 Tax=Polysphondylium violaceum TaxID=133409 RepID=A0A8J4PXJ4_9MYCE|nr:hypothetical protein CYY_003074 [Polysphondylium violaceum]